MSGLSPTDERGVEYGSVVDFKEDVDDVIIRHAHGAHLRASPDNHEILDHKGGYTDWSKWTVRVVEDGKIIRLQSKKTRKFLRISKKADDLLIDDDGSLYSEFFIHTTTVDVPAIADTGSPSPSGDKDETLTMIELESKRFPGHFLTVRPHEGVQISRRKGRSLNLLQFLGRGASPEAAMFSLAYLFQKENTVIIRHPHEGGIAVIDSALSALGTKAPHSRWVATPSKGETAAGSDEASVYVQFKHEATGVWLTVTDEKTVVLSDKETDHSKFRVTVITPPNVVKLESLMVTGAFLSAREDAIVAGKGGPHSQMTILRQF